MEWIAADFESDLISVNNIIPSPICMSWFNGKKAGLTKQVEKYFVGLICDCYEDKNKGLILQNAAFELSIALKHFTNTYFESTSLKEMIFTIVERGQVFDPMLAEQLLQLSTVGNIDMKQTGLEKLALKYLNIDISEDKKNPDSVRKRYKEMVDIPISKWPKKFVTYSLDDSIHEYNVAMEQMKVIRKSGRGSANTLELQIAKGICFALMKEQGMYKNTEGAIKLRDQLKEEIEPAKMLLIERGFIEKKETKKKATGLIEVSEKKNCKKMKEYLETRYPDKITRSKKGGVSLSDEALQLILTYYQDEILIAWNTISNHNMMLNTYLPPMCVDHPKIYTSYVTLKNTGRTSSVKDSKINPSLQFQNPPRTGGFRELIIPPNEDYCILSIDFSGIELCSTAQTLYDIYGQSNMLDLLNYGDVPVDFHCFLAAAVRSKDIHCKVTYEDFLDLKKKDSKLFKKYRNNCKPINLGKPGGRGAKSIRDGAEKDGIVLTLKETEELIEEMFVLMPRLEEFLGNYKKKINTWLDDYITGTVLKTNKLNGRKYNEKLYWYDVNGRVRWGIPYTEAANGKTMQSLTAEGANTAIVDLIRNTDYLPFSFIHDELNFYVLRTTAKKDLEDISYSMIDSMQKYMPNCRISVEASLMDVFTKDEDNHFFTKKLWKDPIK